MQYDFPFILKCPSCLKQFLRITIRSGNTVGSTLWTDGKREAPMLPDQPRLVMCPHCHVPLWVDELEILGRTSHFGKGKDVPRYEVASLADYLALLASGVGDPEKERYVRLRAWWAGNDARAAKTPMSPLEAENRTAFAAILDESDANDLFMKAEIMRELGRFDEALSLLAKSDDEKFLRQAVEFVKHLAGKRDPYVRVLLQP